MYAELEKAGFRAFLPTRVYEAPPDYARPWRGGTQRQAPLFPGYLFVNLDVTLQGWEIATSRRGVHRLLGSSPLKPMAIPEGVIEDLYNQWQAGAYDERPWRVALPRVQVAQAGRVVALGHYTGRVGECEFSSAKRVALRLGRLLVSFAAGQVALVPA